MDSTTAQPGTRVALNSLVQTGTGTIVAPATADSVMVQWDKHETSKPRRVLLKNIRKFEGA